MKQMSDKASRDVMNRSAEKAERIQVLVRALVNKPMPANEAAEWANAVALVAGSILGAMHKGINIPLFEDKRAGDTLAKYIYLGIQIGRGS